MFWSPLDLRLRSKFTLSKLSKEISNRQKKSQKIAKNRPSVFGLGVLQADSIGESTNSTRLVPRRFALALCAQDDTTTPRNDDWK